MEKLHEIFTNHFIMPTYMMWIIFGVIVCVLLFLDLCVFNKKDEEPTIAETFKLSAFYIIIALIFGVFIIYEHGTQDGMLYYTGYLVEKSLSMDNIFVISLIFSSLNIPTKYQHRVLFWGILGAIVMRALMIGIGAQLVSRFHWILYIFSLFLRSFSRFFSAFLSFIFATFSGGYIFARRSVCIIIRTFDTVQ